MKFLYDSIIQFAVFPFGISRWCSKYSCTISSVITPVLHAPYPTAQKCRPQYRFLNAGNSSCNSRELLAQYEKLGDYAINVTEAIDGSRKHVDE